MKRSRRGMKKVRGVLRRAPHKVEQSRRSSFEDVASRAFELASLPVPEYDDGDDDIDEEEEIDFDDDHGDEADFHGIRTRAAALVSSSTTYNYNRSASGGEEYGIQLANKTSNILSSYEDYLKEIEADDNDGPLTNDLKRMESAERASERGSVKREWSFNEYRDKHRRYSDNNSYADTDGSGSRNDNHNLASVQEPGGLGHNYDEDRIRLYSRRLFFLDYRGWIVISICIVSVLAITLSLLKKNNHSQLQEFDEDVSLNQQHDTSKLIDTIHPVWYDRSQAWFGESYSDGVAFCKTISASRTVCPFEVYCPDGHGNSPFQGIQGEDEVGFAPLWEQIWVGVGSSNECIQRWHLTASEKKKVGSILCCIDQHLKNDAGQISQTGASNHTEGILSSTQEAEQIPHKSESQSQQIDSKDKTKITEKEQMAMELFKPSWFGRKDGYNGTSHKESVEFCRSMNGMQLCLAEAICPNGGFVPEINPKPLFLEMDPFPREQWVPIATNANAWLLVGKIDEDPTTTCQTYEELHNYAQPLFGFDDSHPEIKEHVVCCSIPESEEAEEE